ncbi:hypothetical protein [uncultured Clostridium sp.]|uniref:hypothetical protein n=1 Tax=uncultured Clostridium sp. TaxID=59620 RepID=UPI0028E633D8|nr:hypothetical protein [uncultured Clostridium sp.]
MSIVSILATTKYISVMTDGRVTGDDGEIVNECYIKVIRPSENTFIAFTGRTGLFEQLIEGCDFGNSDNYEDITKCVYERFSKIIIKDINLAIVVGGKDKNNELGYNFFSNFGHELTHIKPNEDNELERVLLAKVEYGIDNLLEILIKYIGFDTANKAIAIQSIIHDFEAIYDITVNANKYNVLIEK